MLLCKHLRKHVADLTGGNRAGLVFGDSSHGTVIQIRPLEQYFHVALFIMLYKAVLTLSQWMKPKCA